jgi:hypothetical protein
MALHTRKDADGNVISDYHRFMMAMASGITRNRPMMIT